MRLSKILPAALVLFALATSAMAQTTAPAAYAMPCVQNKHLEVTFELTPKYELVPLRATCADGGRTTTVFKLPGFVGRIEGEYSAIETLLGDIEALRKVMGLFKTPEDFNKAVELIRATGAPKK